MQISFDRKIFKKSVLRESALVATISQNPDKLESLPNGHFEISVKTQLMRKDIIMTFVGHKEDDSIMVQDVMIEKTN